MMGVTGIEPDLVKSDTYKVLAIKKILTGKVRGVVGLKLMWTYGDLLATVKEWSLQTRVESRDAGNMNVDQVRREESPEEGKEGTQAMGQEYEHGYGTGGQPWSYDPWAMNSPGPEIDALGKGKAGGKGYGKMGKGMPYSGNSSWGNYRGMGYPGGGYNNNK